MNHSLAFSKEILEQIYALLKPSIHHTPLMRGNFFDESAEADIYFKCENFQKTGSFKIRGALNAIRHCLQENKLPQFVTHSSGNFGQALSYAAKISGVPAHIIVPEDAPASKSEAIQGYGASIEYCKPGIENRENALKNFLNRHPHALFIHSYDNENVIKGHTTIVYELFLDNIKPDWIVVPVGGGGLISGITLAAEVFFPHAKMAGVEPEAANDALLSLKKGEIVRLDKVQTIADGLKTPLGQITFPVIREKVQNILTVTEEEIRKAHQEILTRMKIVVEPSSAVVWAAIKKNKELFKNKKVVGILSGGNVDFI